jgi:protein ImuA
MSLDDLLRHPALWRAREQGGSSSPAGLPTGYPELDRCLPGGGWPRRGLIEILADRTGIGELTLLLPALARLCGTTDAASRRDTLGTAGDTDGWLAWISPPYSPYAPALAAGGIDVHRMLVVCATPAEWAMEQALRSGACSAVLGWAACRDRQSLRRLQLAAEQANCLAVLFRALGAAREASSAMLRIALEGGRDGLELHILKSRGGHATSLRLATIGSATSASAY